MDKLFQIEPFEKFSNVTKEILNDLYYSKCDSFIDIESTKENLREIIVMSDFNMDKVKDNIKNNSWNRDKINLFISLLEEKQSSLLYSALNHHNCFYGETVINFDWILKLVLGTNELKSLRIPLLQLVLSTSNCKREQTKTYDLTKETILKMIQALEDISGK